MASTLHPATAFCLLLPGDSRLFVSAFPSLICASLEGRAYFSATHFIFWRRKTMIARLSSLSVTGNLFLFFLLLFFPPEYHQWCVFTFSRPKYQFNDSFCRIYKDMGDWRISFHFLSQVFVIWKLVMYFWPGFLFFCEYLLTKNVLSTISSSLSINHSCGFSANSSFINLDFHVHLKHFLFT